MARPFLTAEWRHLVVLNYEVDADLLRDYLPAGVEIDRWNGRCVASIVGFMFRNTKVLGVPIPLHRTFAEVNLRFYVVRHAGAESRRGVVFIREVAPRRAVCWVARTIYNERYLYCPMTAEIREPAGHIGRASYAWNWLGQRLSVDAEYAGDLQPLEPGTFTEFILEHYWAYTRQRDGSTKEYRVAHVPWRTWNVKAHHVVGDLASFYGRQFVEMFGQPPISALVADGSPVEVYPGYRI